jgi:mRNA-degrading endonuclease RelE of RelBE toxin-antitoxin system
MTYQIEFVKQATKQFRALPTQEQERLQSKIEDLTIEPRPNGLAPSPHLGLPDKCPNAFGQNCRNRGLG